MKTTRSLIIFIIGLILAGCAAGGTAATMLPTDTIIPTRTIAPRPTNLLEPSSSITPLSSSIENVDLNQVFDEFGELPSELIFEDRIHDISQMFDTGPVPINALSQLIISKDFHTGIISVFLFEEVEIESAYSLIVQRTLVTEEQEIVFANQIGKFGPIDNPNIGEYSAASYFEEYVDGALSKKSIGTVIQICNVIVSATFSSTDLMADDVFNYLEGVVEILEIYFCDI